MLPIQKIDQQSTLMFTNLTLYSKMPLIISLSVSNRDPKINGNNRQAYINPYFHLSYFVKTDDTEPIKCKMILLIEDYYQFLFRIGRILLLQKKIYQDGIVDDSDLNEDNKIIITYKNEAIKIEPNIIKTENRSINVITIILNDPLYSIDLPIEDAEIMYKILINKDYHGLSLLLMK